MTSDVTIDPTRPASERAYLFVKQQIIAGTLPGGSFVTEGVVAAQLGISRTPVREALLRLQAEDMVELFPKKGALVVPVTAREIREVFEARNLIEEWAATSAWPHRDAFIPRLQVLLDQMRAAHDAHEPGEFSAADRAFHEVIVEAAGNSVITRQYRHLRDRQLCIVTTLMERDEDRMRNALESHGGMLRLLQEGTVEEFTRAAREHVAHTGELVGSR